MPQDSQLWQKVATLAAVVLLVGISLLLALFTGAFNGSSVRFQSSDGEWADSEILFKGWRFEEIVTSFEVYRTGCAPGAVLQRTTASPQWHYYEHWFNDYSSPKWRVPYAPPSGSAAARRHFPPLSLKDHCANRLGTRTEIQDARARAMQFIARMRHNPSIEPTPSGMLRMPPPAAHVER